MFLSRHTNPISLAKANPYRDRNGRFADGPGGASAAPSASSGKVKWNRDVRSREGWRKADESILSAGKIPARDGVAGGSTGQPYVAYVPKRHDATDSRVVIYGYKSYHYNPKGNVETTFYELHRDGKSVARSDTFAGLRERLYSALASKQGQ